MEFIPNNPVYEYTSKTLQDIRRKYNLDAPGRMDESIDLLENWIRKQEHFLKKDFSRGYLERCIINCKGSVEKAKKNMDSLCTLRTVKPQLYGDFDYRDENFQKTFEAVLNNDIVTIFEEVPTTKILIGSYGTMMYNQSNKDLDQHNNIFFSAPSCFTKLVGLPKYAEDYHRVLIIKYTIQQGNKELFRDFIRYALSFCDYWKAHDYFNGCIVILDYRDMNIAEFIASVDLMDFQYTANMYTDVYKARMKAIHILTDSKMVEMVIKLLKQLMSPKLGDRFYVHKTLEDLYEVVPKDILPSEYGGPEKSIKELQDQWIEVLSSKEHRDFMKEMSQAVSHARVKEIHGDDVIGISGTFRSLNVD